MKYTQRSGYAIVLALLAVVLAAASFVVLAATSRNLMFDADRAYARACQRNLKASAMDWVRLNGEDLPNGNQEKPRSLGLEDLSIPDGKLQVCGIEITEGSAKVQIETQCRSGRMRMKSTRKYVVGKPR